MKCIKLLQTTFIASCVALGAMSMAQASNSELDPDVIKGVEAGAKRDYKTADKHLNKAVKRGNPAAEFFLGGLYIYQSAGDTKKQEKGVKLVFDSCGKGYERACKFIAETMVAGKCSQGDQEACNTLKFAK